MKNIYYELKKISNLKFFIIIVGIFATGIFYFYMDLKACDEGLDKGNIYDLIDKYGYEKTLQMEEELLGAYDEVILLFNSEEENKELLFSGEMTAEDFSEYSKKLAKAKKYMYAWQYIMEKHYYVEDNGGFIVFTQYWQSYFKNSFLQPATILMLIIIVISVVFSDKRVGMEEIISCTVTGRKKIKCCKVILSGILTFAAVMCFQIVLLILMGLRGNLEFIKAPINSFDIAISHSNIQLGCFLILYIIIASALTALVSSIITCFLYRPNYTQS